MNDLLLKIKDLIKSNVLVEETETGNENSESWQWRLFGADAIKRNPNELGDLDDEATLSDRFVSDEFRRTQVEEPLGIGYKDKRGEYHVTYRSKLDERNWVPEQIYLPFKSIDGSEIKIPLTLETKTFLKRLFEDLGETVMDESGVSAERFPGLKIRASKIPTKEKKNFRSVLETMPTSYNTNSLFYDVINVLENDSRFNPDDYIIDIISTNKIDNGIDFENLLNEISSYYDKNNFIGKTDNEIRNLIKRSKSHIAIKISKDFTFLPLYSEHPYPPKNSRRGALDKLLWVYKNFVDLKQKSAIEFVDAIKDREKRKKLNITDEQQIDLIRKVYAPGDNEYVKKPIGLDHKSALEPEAVLSLLLDFKSKEKEKDTYIVALISDIGESYIIRTKVDENKKYILRYSTGGNKDDKFGKFTNNFLEGFITRQEYMSGIGYGSLDDEKKSLVNDFILGDGCASVYVLKMMFCDKVDIEYVIDLPGNILTEYGTDEKNTPLPDSIRVPGSQHAAKTSSYIVRSRDMRTNNVKSSIRTTSNDVLNKGSGGFGFMYKSLGYRRDSLITANMLSNSLTSLKSLGDMISTLISELYARVSVDDLTMAIKNKKLNTFSQKYRSIDPTKESVKAILNASTVDSGKYINLIPWSYSDLNFEKTVSKDFDMVYEMVRQLLMQYEKLAKKLMPNEKEMLAEITGTVQLESASPTNLERIENGLIQNVNSCNRYIDIANDVLIDMNIDTDLGLMIGSYFKYLGAKIDDSKKINSDSHSIEKDKIPPSIFTTDIGTLNIGRSRIQVKSDDRKTLVQNILYFESIYNNTIDTAMFNILKSRMSSKSGDIDQVSDVENSIKPLIKILKDLYDWYKNLYTLVEMDGQIADNNDKMDTIKIVTGMRSLVESGLSANELKIESVPNNISSAIANALTTATKSDIQNGFAIDENVKSELGPAVRLVRRAVSDLKSSSGGRKHGYIGLTGMDSPVPYSPIHTIITAFDDGRGVQFCVISSIVGFYATDSEYKYSYENDCVQVKRPVKGKNGETVMEIIPSNGDKEEFKKQMESRSFAHFIYMASNVKNMEHEILETVKKSDSFARDCFDALLDKVNGYRLFYKDDLNADDIEKLIDRDDDWGAAMEKMSQDGEIRSAVGTIDRLIRTQCVLLYNGDY